MTIRFLITTEKPDEIENALKIMDKKLLQKKSGQYGVMSNWFHSKPHEFELNLDYMFQNRASDWVLERELSSTLRKIDGMVKVIRAKKS